MFAVHETGQAKDVSRCPSRRKTHKRFPPAPTAHRAWPRPAHSIAKSIIGLDDVVEQSLAVILSGGHGLLVGAPGLAKTRLVHTLAIVTGLDDKRVQFTPDLMPADILGSEVLEERRGGKRAFRFIPARSSAAADGRRDQPRQPAHPGGPAAGHAGRLRHRGRPAP
jgi:hypothetical protein